MLGIFVIAGCVLMTCAGPPVSGGYSLGTLSGGRGQEYSGGYRTNGFIGMKDSPSDLSDQLVNSGYAAAASSHRHSVAPHVHSTLASAYSSDSGYSESGVGHSSGYGGHADALSGQSSSSSYSSNDVASHAAPTSELGANGGYAAANVGTNGNHVGSGYVEYSEGPASLSGGERGPVEYTSSPHPSPSYVSYSLGGPKAYQSSFNGHRGHNAPSSYSSNPSIGYMSGGHHAPSSSSSSSYYPSESSHTYSSATALGNIISGMHSAGGPPSSNYIHGSSVHRPSPMSHIFAMAANPSPSYSSRGPGPAGYFSSGNSPYSRGGGKIILVKESSGGHMYPGEPHGSYNSGGMLFGGAAGSGYKIRSVGPSYGPNSASPYSSSGGYSGGGHASSGHGGGGLFGFF